MQGERAELLPDSKPLVQQCLLRAKDIVPEATARAGVSIGIHTDRAGRAVDVAVLESSGVTKLDNWIAACFHAAHFEPPEKPKASDYRIVHLEFARQPDGPSRECMVGMRTDMMIKIRPPAETPAAQVPEGSEAIVCGCLTDAAQGPTQPVILSSSNVARFDEGAIALMKQTAAERWSTPFGCTAWKVRLER